MERHEMQTLPNAMTSKVKGLFESPKNAINASTTLAETSENLISDMDGLNQKLRVFRDLDAHEYLIKRVIHQAPRNNTLSSSASRVFCN
jgi:hypothetical protein